MLSSVPVVFHRFPLSGKLLVLPRASRSTYPFAFVDKMTLRLSIIDVLLLISLLFWHAAGQGDVNPRLEPNAPNDRKLKCKDAVLARSLPTTEDCVAAIQTMPQILDPVTFRLPQIWQSQVGTCELKAGLAEGTAEESSNWVYLHLAANQIAFGCRKTSGHAAGSIRTGPTGGITINLARWKGALDEGTASLNGTVIDREITQKL